MTWRVALLALVPACGFQSNASPDVAADSNTGIDSSAVDAPGPDADSTACFGSYPRVCFSSRAFVPTQPRTLGGDIDTSVASACDQHNDQPLYCIIAGAGITLPVGKTVRAFGNKALILLSTDLFELSGTLDVSSTSRTGAARPTGPGIPNLGCNSGAFTATANSGGFGGSFGGKGGDGQRQDAGNGNETPISGPAVAFPGKLRGGCPGGNGSTSTAGAVTGQGGPGGGAVSIIANRILLNGQINASGAAGTAGSAIKSGGGGGGSGGMIVLDAPTITGGPAFALFANGGGGGQGGDSDGAGQNGNESTAPATAGTGGNNTSLDGGAGGAGAAGIQTVGASAPQNGLPGNAGGGGGGGGAGFIRAPGITANIAPPSTNR